MVTLPLTFLGHGTTFWHWGAIPLPFSPPPPPFFSKFLAPLTKKYMYITPQRAQIKRQTSLNNLVYVNSMHFFFLLPYPFIYLSLGISLHTHLCYLCLCVWLYCFLFFLFFFLKIFLFEICCQIVKCWVCVCVRPIITYKENI